MENLSQTPTSPRDYGLLNIVWAGALTALLRATARNGARDAPPPGELPVLGVATFAITKALSKEKVGVWARAPLVERGADGERHPRGRGVHYVLGELVTCSRCLGTWGSLGLVGLRVARPREGRIVASVLATAGLNDIMQAGFSAICAKTNQTESSAQAGASTARHAAASMGAKAPARR
jgi:hypothetical protein